MHVTHLFAGVAVSDLATACDWYENLFGSRPDVFPNEREAMWHAAATGSVYITVEPAHAGHGVLTLAVNDLGETRADLKRRGLAASPGSEANGMQTLTLTDPDGNRIKLFEHPASP